ncbi:MAG: hypothetical protein E7588_00840 [Ruminococcaceae bacterium]|nr:hypothetical protein [Oscillospiraceae bacterium]
MENKVLLILVDGMRPDALDKCGDNYLCKLAEESLSTLEAKTVMPSVTLPCHTSLFYGVEPARHGITTNVWMPMVRPVDSLVDVIAKAGGVCATFYNWEQLRDLWSPGSVDMACFSNLHSSQNTDAMLTDLATGYIRSKNPDFVFLYLGMTDEAGHKDGWMSEAYLKQVKDVNLFIKSIIGRIPKDYTVIVTADHGGHERCHGTNMPEDVTIPLIIKSNLVTPGKLENADIRDIAPTIAKILGVNKPAEWEGKELF